MSAKAVYNPPLTPPAPRLFFYFNSAERECQHSVIKARNLAGLVFPFPEKKITLL